MNNCDCNKSCENPCPKPRVRPCGTPCIGLRTKVITPQMGTDEPDEPYAPKNGFAENTIVVYQANGHVYIYDCKGVYTEMPFCDCSGEGVDLTEVLQKLKELYDPMGIGATVATPDQLDTVNPNTIQPGQMVLVQADPDHDNRPSLYYWNPAAQKWVYAYAASPYYQKPYIDELTNNLQTNINNVMNKEMADVDNLQININKLANNQSVLEDTFNQKFDTIDIEKLNGLLNIKSIGENLTLSEDGELSATGGGTDIDLPTYLVAQDNKHLPGGLMNWQYSGHPSDPNEVYLYPALSLWDSIDKTFVYQGQTMPIPFADSNYPGVMRGSDKAKLDGLANIKSIGANLSLDDNGVLSANGGGVTQIRATDTNNNSQVISRTGNLQVETFTVRHAWSTGGAYGHDSTLSFAKPFLVPPQVVVTPELEWSGVLSTQTSFPDILCGALDTTTTRTGFYYHIPARPAEIPEDTNIIFNIIAIGIAATS